MRPATVSRLTMAAAALMCLLLAFHPPAAEAASYTKISGAGSTWSSNALDQWPQRRLQQRNDRQLRRARLLGGP